MVKVGVITVSDKGSRGEREDQGGPLIMDIVSELGWETEVSVIIPDEQPLIENKLIEYADEVKVDVIFTTGGTGFAPRDVTPEATLAVVDRLAPGIAEAMRMESMKITPKAMLSRAVAGIRGKTLPGLSHGIDVLQGNTGDCAEKKE